MTGVQTCALPIYKNYLVFTYQNAIGQIDVRGIDVAVDYLFNDVYSISATYSNLNRNVWEKAVGAYHSGTPERAEPYAKKVMASWGDAPKTPLVAEGGGGKFNSVSAAPVRRTVSSDATGRDLESYRSRPISTWILAMRATRRP